MSKWWETTLGEVVLLQRGFDLVQKSSPPGPYPVISSSGVSYTTAIAKVEGPGVVTGRKGVLGKVHFSSGPYWPHDTTLWVADFKDSDPRYIYYLLQTLPLASLDAGASNPTLNRNHAHLLPVRVPDRSTQRRIAAVLGALDDLIENNRRRIELLEHIAQAIFREWFVEFRYPGHEDALRVDSNLGPIPEGWDVVSVDEIASVNARTLKASAELGEILYLDISSVSTGHTSEPTPVDFRYAPGRARRQVKHGDVIWSTVRPNRRSHALLIDPPENLIVSTGFAVITPDKVPCSFLYRVLTTDAFVSHLTNRATGAAYPAVTGKVFEEAPVVLPPDELLDHFSAIAGPIDLLVARLQRVSLNLRAARGLLLPRLISGEIDVSDLNIESPAT